MREEIKTCGCGNPAEYPRPHEGRALCGRCFIAAVERTAARALGAVCKTKCKLAIGMSGGSDSAVAAYLLRRLVGGAEIVGITVDEGIGDRSSNIAAAAKLAEQLGIEHRVLTFKDSFGFRMDELPKVRPCTTCGVLRRWLLNREARLAGASALVLGLNADDEAESILLSILRGDHGRFERDAKFRLKPLAKLSKAEISEYARLRGLPFVSAQCPFLVGGLRWRIRQFLSELEKDKPGTKWQLLAFERDHARSGELRKCSCGELTSRERCRACELLATIRGLSSANDSSRPR